MKPTGAETSLEREFDQHFDLPTIRSITPGRPFAWLALGLRDMRENLVESLAYGTVVAIAGWLIWAYTKDRPQLFTTSVTSFFLIAPLLAAGLYEISRRQERNIHNTSANRCRLGCSGGACTFGSRVLWAIFWERLSAILFALSYKGEAPDVQTFFRDVFLSGNYPEVVLAYLAVGTVFAAVVFVVSAISIPMLLARNGDIYTAMATSFLAVTRNIPAMLIWAALIVILTAIASPRCVRMIVILRYSSRNVARVPRPRAVGMTARLIPYPSFRYSDRRGHHCRPGTSTLRGPQEDLSARRARCFRALARGARRPDPARLLRVAMAHME